MIKEYNDLDFIKVAIGALIKYYRKTMNVKVCDMIANNRNCIEYCNSCDKCININKICSTKKLYEIERGEVSNNDCYYYALAANLNKRINVDRRIFTRLKNYQKVLKDNLIDFSKNKLEILSNKIKEELEDYVNVLYISEILTLYLDTIEYFVYHNVPSNEQLVLYMQLLPHLTIEDKKIALNLLYDVCFRVPEEVLNRKQLTEMCKEYEDDQLFFKYKLKQIIELNYIEAYDLLETIEVNSTSLTSYQLCCLLEYKAYVLMNAEAYEKSYDTLKKCINIANNNNQFSNYLIINYYGKLGIVCFLLERYDETIRCFNELLQRNKRLGTNYSLLFYSMEKNNLVDKIPMVINNIDKKEMRKPLVEQIVNYYSAKYTNKVFTKNDYILLENMICTDIKPFLSKHGEIQKMIFTHELKCCVEKTGNYKKYYTFFEN